MKFSVGDIVRVRRWSDLEDEYGTDEYDSIQCPYAFTSGMSKHCGKEIHIDSLVRDYEYGTVEVFSTDLPIDWHWSEEMFEYVTTPVVVSDVQSLQDFL